MASGRQRTTAQQQEFLPFQAWPSVAATHELPSRTPLPASPVVPQGAADPALPVRQRRPLEGERPQAAGGWAPYPNRLAETTTFMTSSWKTRQPGSSPAAPAATINGSK